MGKVLDPVADRLLFLVGAGGILIDGSVPTWFAVVVLVREALVGGATLILAALGARRIDVTWFGKAGTFFLMMAFPLFLAERVRRLVGRHRRGAGLGHRHPRPGPQPVRRPCSTSPWPGGRWRRGAETLSVRAHARGRGGYGRWA